MRAFFYIYWTRFISNGDNLTRKIEPAAPVARMRTPRERDREILGTVETMLGANRIRVRCLDGITRMCRIPGKLKKRVWIQPGNVVIIVPWEIEPDKADVIWRYRDPQVQWLRNNGFMD